MVARTHGLSTHFEPHCRDLKAPLVKKGLLRAVKVITAGGAPPDTAGEEGSAQGSQSDHAINAVASMHSDSCVTSLDVPNATPLPRRPAFITSANQRFGHCDQSKDARHAAPNINDNKYGVTIRIAVHEYSFAWCLGSDCRNPSLPRRRSILSAHPVCIAH